MVSFSLSAVLKYDKYDKYDKYKNINNNVFIVFIRFYSFSAPRSEIPKSIYH